MTVAEDLDSVTTVGDEDKPSDAGLTEAVVEGLWESVRSWYRLGTAPMLQLCLRRNGFVVLNRTIGHGWGNTPGAAPDVPRVLGTPDTPSCAFSTAKGVAAAVMFMLVEQGAFRLNDRVCSTFRSSPRMARTSSRSARCSATARACPLCRATTAGCRWSWTRIWRPKRWSSWGRAGSRTGSASTMR